MEDEEGIASLVRAYLERDGFQVVWETRGLDGLQALLLAEAADRSRQLQGRVSLSD